MFDSQNDWMFQCFDRLGSHFVIWCEFSHDLRYILCQFGDCLVEEVGRMSTVLGNLEVTGLQTFLGGSTVPGRLDW